MAQVEAENGWLVLNCIVYTRIVEIWESRNVSSRHKSCLEICRLKTFSCSFHNCGQSTTRSRPEVSKTRLKVQNFSAKKRDVVNRAKTVGSRVRTTVVRWCDFNFYDFRNMQFRVSLVYDQKKSAVRSGSNASQGVQISYSFRELRLTSTITLLKVI